ncbi:MULTISPECIES: archaetidylserine decarboxylase [unclassified Cobetia]|uniref:archaetidylserine decarboxylase n=1 Tax=unclassified Cobetia TaxID=2609414 RepID=UPI00178C8BD6|nr:MULTISPECIES: archaetidylserine decarboxylase [unclassified Cobetia]MBE2167574.1 phosphatidylserine decarboxylase [Cobetia sp. 2AS1]MDH2445996.1 archaetidylserine decarboxylase [Cobetia sp. 2AS]
MDRAKLFSLSQYPLPQHLISRLIGRIAACENPWVKNTFIERFIKAYDVNMSEALEENPRAYACFNDFFTRALKQEARPIEEGLVSPADGVLSQFGAISHGTLVQAKGQAFSLTQLLGGSEERAAPFRNGRFATVYLSPKDYHRVHMPLAGRLVEMAYVPGRLFSVNEATATHVPGLFARNERLVCIFETEHGPMAMVLVGAMIVAAIKTVWSGQVTPLSGDVETTRFDQLIELARGAEMGRFQLGSTVVMCFPDSVEFDDALTPGQKVSMGQSLGMRPSATAPAPAESEEHATETAQGTPATDEK